MTDAKERKVRYAVIGLGNIAQVAVLPAFAHAKESSELVALISSDPEKLLALGSECYPKRDQFAPELVHFSNAILEGTEAEPSGEEGLCDVRILEAIATSARTGQRVRLAPFVRSDRPTLELESKKPAVGRVSTVHAPSPNKNS